MNFKPYFLIGLELVHIRSYTWCWCKWHSLLQESTCISVNSRYDYQLLLPWR